MSFQQNGVSEECMKTKGFEVNDASTPDATVKESTEVALRGQIITPLQHKVVQVLSVLMTLLSLAAFALAFVFKLTKQEVLVHQQYSQKTNIAFASFNLIFLGALLCVYSYNLILLHRAKYTWSRRKRSIAYIAFAQLIVQVINTMLFLVPNVHAHSRRCTSLFSVVGFLSLTVRWTMWNSLFFLICVHAHNLCPWVDNEGKLKRGVPQRRGLAEGKEQDGDKEEVPLIIMDAPVWIHLPKFVYWCIFEFCIIWLATGAPNLYDYGYKVNGGAQGNSIHVTRDGMKTDIVCQNKRYVCEPGVQFKVFTSLWIGFIFFYIFLIWHYITLARKRLLKGRYNELVLIYMMVLRQRTQVRYLSLIGVSMVPILWYTRWQRCNNYFIAILGLLPLQVIASSVVFINCFYFMPLRPGNKSIQQAWLQNIAWEESGYEQALERRAQPHDEEVREKLRHEPMFCFERAIKLALWSELVYTYALAETAAAVAVKEGQEGTGAVAISCCGGACGGSRPGEEEGSGSMGTHVVIPVEEVSITPRNSRAEAVGKSSSAARLKEKLQREAAMACDTLLETAMEMYDLEHHEIIHEELLETRVLLAWSSSRLVVAFRGTAKKQNVLSDAKAWRTAHPPHRGRWFLATHPMVHKGFLQTWKANQLSERVLQRILSIVDAGSVPSDAFEIFLTGHSLGGSLATLAAIDLQKKRHFPRLQVYTYGCPRTGNHAFSREYEELCPQTWHVINARDAVPANMKFYMMYKRCGKRVLINSLGDIRVRPSPLELTIYGGGYSIRQHFMASYVGSLWSICVTQCMPDRAEPGGREGVHALGRSKQLQAYFATLGLDLAELVSLPEGAVKLPELELKESKLEGCGCDFSCCGFGIVEPVVGFLRDAIAPCTDAAASLATMLSGGGLGSQADAALREEDTLANPQQLGQRASRVSMQMHAPLKPVP